MRVVLILLLASMLVSVQSFAKDKPDADDDGIADDIDNCRLAFNSAQIDTDRDGYGNRCDGDFNNDGLTNGSDFVEFRGHLIAQDSLVCDHDGNGICENYFDFYIFKRLYGKPPGPSGLLENPKAD